MNFDNPRFIGLLAFALVVVQAIYFTIAGFFMKWDLSHLGTFGDTFGALNTTFTGFAFLGLLHSLALQRKELKSAHEETDRLKSLEKKREFESTFFQLLEFFEGTLDRLTTRQRSFRGLFSDYTRDVYDYLCKYDRNAETISECISIEAITSGYMDFYTDKEDVLGPYFRSLYHLFRYVDKSDLPKSDKHFYCDICRAQLSATQLEMLYFNGLTEYGVKFRVLIERYGILKHLGSSLANRKGMKDYYKPSAFED